MIIIDVQEEEKIENDEKTKKPKQKKFCLGFFIYL